MGKEDTTSKEASIEAAPSGCPVKGVGYEGTSSADEQPRGFLSGWFQSSNSINGGVAQSSSLSECPVKGGNEAIPASIEEAA